MIHFRSYDPTAKRTQDNFNPFEKNEDGNSVDTNGYFPGETRYSDPIRPDVSYATMQAELKAYAAAAADPKNSVKGPGCYQGFNKMQPGN